MVEGFILAAPVVTAFEKQNLSLPLLLRSTSPPHTCIRFGFL